MQDQLTGGQTNLQQPRNDLQQNAPSLQQGSSPGVSPNSTNLLSQPPPTKQLQVQTLGQESPVPTGANNVGGSNFLLLALIIVPIAIAIALFWPTKKQRTVAVAATEPVQEAAVAVPKKSKAKKKTSKRKRSGKR